jgi:hypothetical protein
MSETLDKRLKKAKKIVEKVIVGLALDPDENAVEAARGGYAWQLARGSADIFISLIPGKKDTFGRLRIVSPVVKMQDGLTLEMSTRLLQLNGTELPGVAFGVISQDVIALVCERTLAGLDKEEVRELVDQIGYLGDLYDDLLVNDFGGTRVCDARRS